MNELQNLKDAVDRNTVSLTALSARVAALQSSQINPADVQAAADQITKNNASLDAILPLAAPSPAPVPAPAPSPAAPLTGGN